jgi:molecular chaperone DnaJ
VLSASEVVVEVPQGSHDGDEVRLAGMGNAGTNGQTSGDFICRVLLPSERVNPRQAQGLTMMGFGLPLVATGLIGSGWQFNMFLGLLLVALGLVQVVQAGLSTNRRWLRNAMATVGNGAVRAVALVAVMLVAVLAGPWLGMMLPLVFVFAMLGRRRQ